MLQKPSLDIVIPVRNNPTHICNCLHSVLSQKYHSIRSTAVIVVNDASTDHTMDIVKEHFRNISSINLTQNQGRAAARDIGARHGHGDIICFLDSDCCFADDKCLEKHTQKILRGYDASCGKIIVQGKVFWDRYTTEIDQQREKRIKLNDFSLLTTANFAIKRKSYFKNKGFDHRYKKYGFEDRDFIVRMIEQGMSIAYTPESRANHMCSLQLANITRKMMEAGQYSSLLFAKDHPRVYSKMLYSHIDVRLKSYLFWPAIMLDRCLPLILKCSEKIVKSSIINYQTKALTAKLLFATAFLIGTSKRTKIINDDNIPTSESVHDK